MDQRISFVTLAVADLEVSRRFYLDGLGWIPELEADGVVMLAAGEHLMLSLWDLAEFHEEVGATVRHDGRLPFTLAHNVRAPHEVDDVLALAVSAGATLSGAAREREWGGYTGYFEDPDGFTWEVAYNPGPIGQKVLP